MEAALLVAELHDVAEDGDHQVVDLLFLINLLVHHSGQTALLGVEHNRVDNTPAHHHHVEGPADVVGHTHIIRVLYKVVGALCGDHDNRHAINPIIFVHGGQYIEAVHIGHNKIQKDQGNLLLLLLEDGDGLKAVLRLHDVIGLLQHRAQDFPVHF